MARYEFSDGKSSKFWEIDLTGTSFTVRFGRIGTGGQAQTKSFASAQLASREHDKLVAEKTKKGYALVAGTGAPAPAALAPGKKPAAASGRTLRKDLYVYNEATGFTITSRRIGGKGWDGGGKEWMKGVRNGDLIPIELVQDDPFVMRVVVGGELDAQEAAEWVGRLDWKLRVPDGNLVVCGGAEYIMEAFADEEDSFMAEYLRHVKIPRGEYRASVYMYMGGVNGRACMQAARGGDEPDPLGEWFRRSRPGEKFPAWLHNACVIDPSEDPGHENEWKGVERIEDPNKYYVDFLLHLVPLEPGAEVAMPQLSGEGGDAGWFANPNECRVPDTIPLGIVAHDVIGVPKKADPDAVHPLDVFQYTQDFARSPLDGGPVEVRVDALQQLFRVPWFCHAWSAPQMKIELPNGAVFEAGERIPNVLITRAGDTLNVGIQSDGGQSSGVRTLAEVSRRLAALPDGSVVELDAAYGSEKELKKERPMGLHRYRGTVRAGMLRVEETFPAVAAGRLAAALALSGQVDSGDAIDAGDPALRTKVLALLKKHAFFDDNPAVPRGATSIAMEAPEPVMLNYVAAEVFKFGFKDAWRILDLDDEEDDDEDEDAETTKADAASNMPPRPARGETLLEAPKRAYNLSDAAGMGPEARKRIADVETALLPLGFAFVADITFTELQYGLIRAYARPGGSAWAALTLGSYGRGSFEFVEFFNDGASLTTTDNFMVRDEIYRDAYKSVRQNKAIASMWSDHAERSGYLAGLHGGSRKVEATARGLAADVQRSVRNQENKLARKPLLLVGDDGRTHYAADAKAIHPDAPRLAAEADAAMNALGFTHVGDVVSSFFSATVFRGYARTGDVWFKYCIDASGEKVDGYWELATIFPSGACLVTTRAAMSKDEPKRKIYRILDGKSAPQALLGLHEKRREELAKKHGTPLAITADLNSLAVEVEAAFVRIMG
jgi:predicted DNA-binding WGR domain protein